jgi:hypothetical protein
MARPQRGTHRFTEEPVPVVFRHPKVPTSRDPVIPNADCAEP